MTKTARETHQDFQTEANGRTTVICYAVGAAMAEVDENGKCGWCRQTVACGECKVPSGQPCRPWCPQEAHQDA